MVWGTTKEGSGQVGKIEIIEVKEKRVDLGPKQVDRMSTWTKYSYLSSGGGCGGGLKPVKRATKPRLTRMEL